MSGVIRPFLILALAACAACTDRLPDQDLRILSATPAERLSASVLWDDYQNDPAAADRRYRGVALVVTGAPVVPEDAAQGARSLRFVLDAERKGSVRANLLDEQAEAVLGSAKEGELLALKCYCQGRSGDEIILKSCVAP